MGVSVSLARSITISADITEHHQLEPPFTETNSNVQEERTPTPRSQGSETMGKNCVGREVVCMPLPTLRVSLYLSLFV